MTLVGAHNDPNNQMREELWGLIAPATGANNVVVNANITNGGTVGMVAGAMDFSGVNQATPLQAQSGGTCGSNYVSPMMPSPPTFVLAYDCGHGDHRNFRSISGGPGFGCGYHHHHSWLREKPRSGMLVLAPPIPRMSLALAVSGRGPLR